MSLDLFKTFVYLVPPKKIYKDLTKTEEYNPKIHFFTRAILYSNSNMKCMDISFIHKKVCHQDA